MILLVSMYDIISNFNINFIIIRYDDIIFIIINIVIMTYWYLNNYL